ncbi:MAG: NAD(P)/FAD-dependent oxidoreductase [Deltaproteobacteria bacterium]
MGEQLQGNFHTIVIGAGPGGLACATALARNGKEVLLLERQREVGHKVCAGGITLSGLSGRLPAELIEKSFQQQHIFSPTQRIVLRAPDPIVSTVDRRKLGQWMLAQAQAAGVVVMTSTRALRVEKGYVETSAGRFSFRYLVGADGSSSLVRRSLGLASEQVGTGLHCLVPGNFDRMEWHLDYDLFRNGYAWIFPRRGAASVGAYASRQGVQPRELLRCLQEWGKRQGIELREARLQAALINFDYRGWRFGNVFLVGDAAGLASGLTGEGIYPAVLSGETTAATILDSRYRSQRLERLIDKHLRHRRVLHFLRGRLACRLSMETFIFALRTGVVKFRALEMGD